MTENTSENHVPDDSPTAAMLAIGDELLSGRTRDANIQVLARFLDARGVTLREVRIVPDEEDRIARAVNALRAENDFLFTSGGIGPTHDDITALAVGAAFGVGVAERQDALEVLRSWYDAAGEELTDARRRMARIPDGASLIANSVSGAPGFHLENTFVFAGVPSIFRAMLDAAGPSIARGALVNRVTVRGGGPESRIADGLSTLQSALKGVKIGSYPGDGEGLEVVISARDRALAEKAARAVEGLFRATGVEPETLWNQNARTPD